MTEEEVQGAHNQQPTQGTREPQGTPRGAQRGVGFPQETWWDDPGFFVAEATTWQQGSCYHRV